MNPDTVISGTFVIVSTTDTNYLFFNAKKNAMLGAITK